jgi:hypothetical protein
MTSIEFANGEVLVDAAVIARGLKLEPGAVQKMMREGRITSLCERGTGEDDGRYRLTFFSSNRRFRLIVNETGRIVQRLGLDFGDRPMPASAHIPGRSESGRHERRGETRALTGQESKQHGEVPGSPGEI